MLDNHVIVFGGTFSPMGLHHLEAIRWVRQEYPFAQVWVIPSYKHPLKDQSQIAPFDTRVLIAQASVEGLNDHRVKVLDIERDAAKDKPFLLTFDLLSFLKHRFPRTFFKFAVGLDQDISKWERREDVERDFGFVRIPTKGSVHATEIRRMIQEGEQGWRRHVAPQAENLIQVLYR